MKKKLPSGVRMLLTTFGFEICGGVERAEEEICNF